MRDPRHDAVAKILVDYSTKVQPRETVQITGQIGATPLMLEIYKLCLERGALPVLHPSLPGAAYTFYKHAQDFQLKHFPKVSWYEVRNTDVFFSIGAEYNTKEFTNVDPKRLAMRKRAVKRIQDWRVNNTRWCLFEFPQQAGAQDANMALPEYEEFVYNSTIIDWETFAEELRRICDVVNQSKKVRIMGKDTDLSFSIKGMNCIAGDGRYNMPDGEVFTAPVRDSVNGHIYYDVPTVYNGVEVEGIYLEFKDGHCVKATAEKNEEFLKTMLDQDPGAGFIGEFGIGCNNKIQKATKNILFDEKIGGTIHLAMGQSYKENRGRNMSALHWDMIKDLRQEGTVLFDDRIFLQNGKIVM
ncbi:aminopeptidase [Candidatus Woesearchaeota archaeon]|nr:aminopeptidase [Candidatus Woesearchaeota archaeon]